MVVVLITTEIHPMKILSYRIFVNRFYEKTWIYGNPLSLAREGRVKGC
jgi:hypothetical protein